MLTPAETAFVKSAVIFGDPDNGKAVGTVSAADTLVVCHKGDLICAGTALVLAPHLTYAKDAGTAAAFVVANAGAAKAKAKADADAEAAVDAAMNGTAVDLGAGGNGTAMGTR